MKRKKRGPGRPKKGASPGTPGEVRQKLVDAAIQLVREHGAKAVTTTALAKTVGISQSGFYQHFVNVDECLGAAAVSFAEQMRLELRSIRDRFFAHLSGPHDQNLAEQLRKSFHHSLGYVVDEPRLLELILMFRRFLGDTSEFGLALQKVNDQVLEEMIAELYAAGKRQGTLTQKDLPAVRIYARISLSIWEAGVELLIANPNRDRELVVDMLARSQQAILNAHVPVLQRPRDRAARRE